MKSVRSILVVCDGNYCRSPMAEGLLRKALKGKAHVASAGLCALIGFQADPNARRLMSELGVPIEEHRGRLLSPDMALSSDLILVMEPKQRDACASLYPSTLGRIFLLGHWLEEPRRIIPDPNRKGTAAMKAALDHIQEALATWLPQLIKE